MEEEEEMQHQSSATHQESPCPAVHALHHDVETPPSHRHRTRVPAPRAEGTAKQGLTLLHFSAQPKPLWSTLHLTVSPCLIDRGKIMHPIHPTKCAYVEPKGRRVCAPAAAALPPPHAPERCRHLGPAI
jgi:hypothetical protein